MKNYCLIIAVLGLHFVGLSSAVADGLVNHGHINGERTILLLSPQQIMELSHGSKLVLTAQQKKAMLRATGVANVDSMTILPRTTKTCTCDLRNVGIRTGSSTVEVSNSLFGRDFSTEYPGSEAGDKYIKERESEEKAEARLSGSHPEIQLRKKAHAMHDAAAIPLLKQAIAINPHYKLARWDLASSYRTLALDSSGPVESLPKKEAQLKDALAALDNTQPFLVKSISQDLQRVQNRIRANKEK